MKKAALELLLFYQETEARNLKFFIKKAFEERQQEDMNFYLEKLQAILQKIEAYKKMPKTFDLYYWVAKFNDCQNEAEYQKVSKAYDKMLAQLEPSAQNKAREDFKNYTLKRLERLEKNLALSEELLQEEQLTQKAILENE